jgi:hypothetical protein
VIESKQWYTYVKEWKLVRKAHKRGSDMLSEVEESFRNARQTVINSLAPINENSNNGIGDEQEIADTSTSLRNQFQRSAVDDKSGVAEDNSPSLRSQFQRSETVIMAKDASDFMNEKEVENNIRWKVIAARVDDASRFWFPLAYSITLAIILSEVF